MIDYVTCVPPVAQDNVPERTDNLQLAQKGARFRGRILTYV